MSYEEWAATLFPFEAKTLTRKEIFQAGAASRDVEIAELVEALESVEWTRLGEMPEGNRCCYCGALKKHGHVTGCKVANVLKRTTLAQALAKLRKPLAGLCPTKVGREAKPAG